MLLLYVFFGSLVGLLAASAALLWFLAKRLPGEVARPKLFMICNSVLGIVLAVTVWAWFYEPLTQIGIAGGQQPDDQGWPKEAAYLAVRFVAAFLALILAETTVFFSSRALFLKRRTAD